MMRWLLLLLISVLAVQADETVFRRALVLPRTEAPGRGMFHVDPIEESIVRGQWRPPTLSAAVPFEKTNLLWRAAGAGPDDVFTNRELEGGYLDYQFNSESDEVRLLAAAGQDVVYVNGEARPGDPYSNGILELPVLLHRGANDFLFKVGRGRLKASLLEPPRPISLYQRDVTLPDIVRGDKSPQLAAVVIVNCTTNFLRRLSLRARLEGADAQENIVPSVPPLSVRKIGFLFQPRWTDRTNRLRLELRLLTPEGRQLDQASLGVALKRQTEHYNLTFRSDIDGSVQYFAVAPATPLPGEKARALFFSTHGASVEATSQAAAYQSKTWGTVVAPTNRRPYGFDWEEWGERDALEVLNLALTKFNIDPQAVYLTGHSMGGHGAWHLGVTYPDRFAAVAPSAGWISFWSYGGIERAAHPDPVQQMLQRASNPGDTLGLISNCLHFGVYILHGAEDENVPVSEARTMRDRLSQFHHDWLYHEQPGAGHWWGNQCVDWPPIFDLFARHRIPGDDEVYDLNFTTMNPGESSSSHWLAIEEQQHPLEKSVVTAHYDVAQHAFSIATENVARLQLRPGKIAPQGVARVTLDGQSLGTTHGDMAWFERDGDAWKAGAAPAPNRKGPRRYGPFKMAFDHRMVFVYATHGSPDENAWAASKCRFDAETWWYRGNGAVDVVPDRDFDASKETDRGVVLYGNADNNTAWPALLADSPVQVHEGLVQIGSHAYAGDDLACLFCRPRPGSDRACVAVVGGAGLVGLRLTTRAPYFIAGVTFPDCMVYGPGTLSNGTEGVRAAGFFGMDWGVQTGDFAWR